jgi:large repetitive protein
MNRQIIFVDSSVEDYQILAQNAAEGSKVVILDDQSSAIEQITQSLVGESDIEALHIISHGNEGSITLGTEVINETAIETFRDRLKQWGKALTKTGDILLYGCNVATGEIGKKFVKKLSEITGAGVAASNNLTGAAALGGDWNLEVRFGEVETQPLNFANYGYTLPATITNVTSGLATGTYKAGQLVPITVTFSGNVDVASAAGFPGFTLNTGGTAFYTGVGSGTNTLNFNYIVATGENNADLNYTSLALNGTIYDAGTTTPATLTLPLSTGAGSLGTNANLVIDAKAPTVTSIVRKTPTASAINTATTSVTYTVTFDEPVNSLDATDFTVTQVSGAATTTPPVVVAATTASNTVDVTVNGIAGGDGVFRLDVPATATINDAVANALTTAFTSGQTYSRDGTAPLATNITSATADGSYTTTTTIPITVTFNEAVNVTGSPTLTLDSGTATYTSGTGTNTLTFNYTPAAGNTSADLNATAIAGTITDIAGNAYALALPATTLAATKALVIDTTAPTVALTSAAAATVTAPFTVTATFTEASGSVTGFTAADITVANGAASALTGGPLIYTFTVTPTTDGLVTVNIPANGVTDTATNGNTVATALTRTADLPPTITNVSSSLTDGSYGTVAVAPYTGTIPITVTFSKAVNVTGAPTLALSTGGTATYASGTGSPNLIFNYPVAAGQTSADLDYTATTALTGGTIASLAGTAAVTTLPAPAAAGSLGGNKALVIDTTPPAITSITTTTADGSYGLTNGPINVTVNFSEPVTSTTPITVTLDSGATVSIPAITSSASAVGSYTPANPETSADLNSTAVAGTITDAAGNPATLTIPAGFSLTDGKAIVVDTIVPTVALTTTAVSPVATTFSVKADFTEASGSVLGFDITDITVGNGTISNFAGTGLNYTFDVTPTADGPVTIDVPASKATDTALNPNTAAPTLLVQANVPPKVTSITSTLADGSYPLGQVVPITVTFSEPVVVTTTGGTPTLALNSGGTASYASGTGTNTLTFNYTVGTGQNTLDLDYSATTSLVLNGGTINDSVVTTSAAILTLPAPAAINSLGANKAIVIDTTPPTVTINQASSQVDPTSNSLINYTVVFSEPVKNFDATDLTFTGITGAAATVTGDGTGQNYNVAVTGLSAPGTLTATVKASGATDLAGNGNTASTSTDNSVTYSPAPPLVTAINKVDPDPTKATTVNYAVTFNEAVTGVDAADFTLVTKGVTGATIGAVTGSGKTYNVAVNTGTLDGTVGLDLVDDNTIINALKAPLGGAALKDGDFKGQIYTVGKNVPPVVATAITDQSASLNTAFSYIVPTGTFTDANNDTLTYTATKDDGTTLPTWLTFNAATQTFSGTPATTDIGNLKVKVTANDGQATASNTFLLSVSNTPPVVASVINDQSATPSTAFTYTVPTGTFTDANKDTLTYTATKDDGTALPTWLTFNAATQTFTGTPATADLGVVQVKVVASDGLATANDTFLLTVADKANTAPVLATAITDKATNIDTAFNFTVPTGTFTDAESDPLTYTATQENGTALPTWLTFNATTLAFSGTPAQANVGNIKVKLTANDGKASTSDVFQIVVNGPAPVFTPAPAPAPSPSPSGGGTTTTTTTTVGGAIEINTPPISLIDRGQPTNLPPNQVVDGQYLLSDGDDNSIPTSAFGQAIRGLSGNDNLTGSSNGDNIFGDRGSDIINGGDGNDSLFGGKESDQLSGGNGDDFLSGNNDNDTLTGGAGNDIMRGGKENDVLLGGDGDDELWGDRGFDALTGGAGKDQFVLQFTATSADQADVITDFNATDDKIKLSGFTFSQLSFESVSVVLDGATAVASTAIKSGNSYLGVVYNVNSTALNSGSFL